MGRSTRTLFSFMNDLLLSNIGDAIIELPIEYIANGQTFYLYPPSLGSTILMNKALSRDIQEHELIAELLAICSFENRADAKYVSRLRQRKEQIKGASIAELMPIYMMFAEWKKDLEGFIKHFHLDLEQKYMQRAHEAKDKNSGSMVFNGKSIYGTLIDVVCERYGWSMDYVVWGISLNNLNMLMADKVVNVFLTKEESKKAAIPNNRDVLKVNKNTSIKEMLAHLKG